MNCSCRRHSAPVVITRAEVLDVSGMIVYIVSLYALVTTLSRRIARNFGSAIFPILVTNGSSASSVVT
jgi:hypothetical protein